MKLKTDLSPAVYSRAMDCRQSVVQVIVWRSGSRGPSGQGSGFVISLDDQATGAPSLVLTCEHVVSGAVRLLVRKLLPAGGVAQLLSGTVLASDFSLDIALIQVPGLSNAPPLEALSLTLDCEIDDCAAAIGYSNPRGLFDRTAFARLPLITPGSIQRIRTYSRYMTDAEIVPMRFYLDSAITTGVSGGPVVGSDGVLGMCTQMGAQETYTIAVSSRTILQTFRGWAGLPINGDSTLEEAISLVI